MSAAVIPERFTQVLAELAPLVQRFVDAGHRLYLVGGAVRDLLLGEHTNELDYDLTTDARPPQIKACLHGWASAIWEQGERFGTIGARRSSGQGERTFEITTFRSDVYADDSRKPQVSFSDTIDEDLARRDFTINAIALELTGTPSGHPVLVDPYGGALDLVNRVLRTPRRAAAQLRRRPAADVAGGPLHRPLRADTGSRGGGRRPWPAPLDWRSSRRNGSATSSTS